MAHGRSKKTTKAQPAAKAKATSKKAARDSAARAQATLPNVSGTSTAGAAVDVGNLGGEIVVTLPPHPQQDKIAKLTAYGTVRDVLFGELRNDHNAREVPLTAEESAELLESIRARGSHTRMKAWQDERGHWQLLGGGNRFEALTKLGYPLDAPISIEVVERPASIAEAIMRSAGDNLGRVSMKWPDLAHAVGVGIGLIDEATGKIRTEAEIKALPKGSYPGRAELAERLHMSPITLDSYRRIARAPLPLLLRLYNEGCTVRRAEEFVKYPEKDWEKIVTHFEVQHEFPREVQPQRSPRAREGAGRKKKPEPDPKASPAVWTGGDGQPVPPGPRKTPTRLVQPTRPVQRTDPTPRPVLDPPNGDSRTLSLFDQPIVDEPARFTLTQTSTADSETSRPKPKLEELQALGDRVLHDTSDDASDRGSSVGFTATLGTEPRRSYLRAQEQIDDLCDRFGVPPALVTFLDALVGDWILLPLSAWELSRIDAVQDAVAALQASNVLRD